MEWIFGDYRISTDKSLLSVAKVAEMLGQSYWAAARPVELIEKSLINSLCYGIYRGYEQVGFARVVSDYATVYWICDVFVAEGHRGHELGKRLVECIINTPELNEVKGIKGMLATRDAHGLYEQYGFKTVDSSFMRRAVD